MPTQQDETPTTYTIGDIAHTEDLVRFAVAAQLGLVGGRHARVSRAQVAEAADLSASALSRKLSGASEIKDADLRQFDDAFAAVGLEEAGGLSALGVRLRGGDDTRALLMAHIPPRWGDEMLGRHTNQELGVMLQATALVTRLRAAHRARRPIREAYKEEVKRIVNQLVHIGAAPPTWRNVEALILLGTLAGYAFPYMSEELESALAAPLGFRVWRAVTKCVLLNAPNPGSKRVGRASAVETNELKAFVEKQLRRAEELRESSLYPGRSLDLELAIIIPRAWSRSADGTDWVVQVLSTRASNQAATLRERGTAAFGLLQRAVDGPAADAATIRTHVTALTAQFRETPRADIAEGLRWTAATLEQCLAEKTAVCNQWPATDSPWFATVMRASTLLDREAIPTEVLPGARTLFEHVLLQNAGVYRRHAIETLIAAGLAKYVTEALIYVLENEKDEHWLRIRALFALGFLQRRDDRAIRTLTSTGRQAYQALDFEKPDGNPPSLVTELHAGLFAIGDCVGSRGAEDAARRARDAIATELNKLVNDGLTLHEAMWPIARATAYLLTVTAQPRAKTQTEPDLSQALLEKLESHPDPVTQSLATWARFRFGRDGRVRPLLDATNPDPDEDDETGAGAS
jgi:hypothetical protein